jgi:predicted ABC-type ATPase
VVILAGPNGAGKSTAAPALLQGTLDVTEFVNADDIARGLSAFNPEGAAIAAGRVMLTRLRELAEQRVSFAFETTLASRSFAPWLKDLKTRGYTVHIFFLWLPRSELAVRRVSARVRMGGHDVPASTIQRRHETGIRNFFSLYEPIASTWTVFDASQQTLKPVAERIEPGGIQVYDESRWTTILAQGKR